jgi:hypothetical protein
MTRSPVALARKALEVADSAFPAYSARRSRKDFTQQQHFALLVLMTFLKTDHRGIVALVADWSDLKQTLKLKKVPHYTTLFKAQKRLMEKGDSISLSIPASTPAKTPVW